MKPLHIIPGDKPWQHFIQVRNGFVWSVSSKEFVKIPAAEVFGKEIVKDEEELYFHKSLWEACRASDADKVTREGNLFKFWKNEAIIGYLMPAGTVGEKSGEFIVVGKSFKFPDCDKIIAQGNAVLRVGLNGASIDRVAQALGVSTSDVELARIDDSQKFPHLIYPNATAAAKCTGIGGSAVLAGLVYEFTGSSSEDDYKAIQKATIEELENKLEAGNKEIEKLEVEKAEALARAEEAETVIFGTQQVDLIGGKLHYKTDNLLLAEVLESFVEVMKNAENPREVMETLTMMA